MAISKEQWEAMVPGKTKIKEHNGEVDDVVARVQTEPFYRFTLHRVSDGREDDFQLVDDSGDGPAIVDEEWGIDLDLNHEDTNIIS